MPHQRPHESSTHEPQERPQDSVPTTWPARAGEEQTETWEGGLITKGSWYCKLRSELAPQTPQARRVPTRRQGKPNSEQSTAPTEAENRRRGQQNNQHIPRGKGSHKASPYCHTKSSHNHHGSSLTQGETRQDSRCTAPRTQGKGGSPTNAISAAVGRQTGTKKRQKPRRVSCGRACRAKPQASEAEHGTRVKTPSAARKTPQTQQT